LLPFGIGFSEVMLILVVVLLVVGPQKLPEMAKTLGKGVRMLRRAGDDLRDAIQVDEIRRSVYEEPVEAWRDATRLEDPDAEAAAAHGEGPYVEAEATDAEIEDAVVEPTAPPAAEPASEAPPASGVAPADTVARGSQPSGDDEPTDA